jgi:DHA1 family multidrug resistance protein-like MFS transporter
MALATHAWHLIALQALFGIAAGGMIPAANAIIANITPADQRGFTYGITAAAGGLGSAMGPLLISSLIAPALGFETAFLTVAVLLMGLGGVLWYVVRNRARAMALTESVFIAPGRGD